MKHTRRKAFAKKVQSLFKRETRRMPAAPNTLKSCAHTPTWMKMFDLLSYSCCYTISTLLKAGNQLSQILVVAVLVIVAIIVVKLK